MKTTNNYKYVLNFKLPHCHRPFCLCTTVGQQINVENANAFTEEGYEFRALSQPKRDVVRTHKHKCVKITKF